MPLIDDHPDAWIRDLLNQFDADRFAWSRRRHLAGRLAMAADQLFESGELFSAMVVRIFAELCQQKTPQTLTQESWVRLEPMPVWDNPDRPLEIHWQFDLELGGIDDVAQLVASTESSARICLSATVLDRVTLVQMLYGRYAADLSEVTGVDLSLPTYDQTIPTPGTAFVENWLSTIEPILRVGIRALRLDGVPLNDAVLDRLDLALETNPTEWSLIRCSQTRSQASRMGMTSWFPALESYRLDAFQLLNFDALCESLAGPWPTGARRLEYDGILSYFEGVFEEGMDRALGRIASAPWTTFRFRLTNINQSGFVGMFDPFYNDSTPPEEIEAVLYDSHFAHDDLANARFTKALLGWLDGRRLIELSLRGLVIDAEAARSLVTMATPSLTRLDLSGCRLSDGALNELTRLADQLERLALSRVAWDRGGVRQLWSGPPWTRLRVLKLDFNDLVDEEIISMAESDRLPALEQLDLGANQIRRRGMSALCQEPTLRGLRALRLASNRITPRELAPLLQSPILGRLDHLDLRHCGLTPQMARDLADQDSLRNRARRIGVRKLPNNATDRATFNWLERVGVRCLEWMIWDC